jgi:hypothetical protein
MKLGDVKQVLKALIENKTGVTPMLWGRHGIGKSSIVAALGEEIGYRTQTIILSQRDAVDLNGMLYIHQHPTLGSVTSNHPPDWFADALQNGKLILFLDEYNLSRREVINASAELINDRRLNGRKLPDDVFIVCAGNPPDDERYDVSSMSSMTLDRLMHIHVEADLDATLAYAREADMAGKSRWNEDAINFLALNPQAFFKANEADHKFPVEIDYSPRSWERAQKMYNLTQLSLELRRECMRGLIGTELATSFINYLSKPATERPLTAKQLFESDAKTVKASLELFESWTSKKKNSDVPFDLVNITIDNAIAYAKGRCKDLTLVGDRKEFSQLKDETEKFYKENGKTLVSLVRLAPESVAKRMISEIYFIDNFADDVMKDARLQEIANSHKAAKALMEKAGVKKQ